MQRKLCTPFFYRCSILILRIEKAVPRNEFCAVLCHVGYVLRNGYFPKHRVVYRPCKGCFFTARNVLVRLVFVKVRERILFCGKNAAFVCRSRYVAAVALHTANGSGVFRAVLIFRGIFATGLDIASVLWYIFVRRAVIPSVLDVHPGGCAIWRGRSSSSFFYLFSKPSYIRDCSGTDFYHLLIIKPFTVIHGFKIISRTVVALFVVNAILTVFFFNIVHIIIIFDYIRYLF